MKYVLKKTVLFLVGGLLLLSACKNDEIDDTLLNAALDQELTDLINARSNGEGKDFFVLPDSDDFDEIPQDLRNPLTKEKVELGKLLFHETGIALAPVQDIHKETYSCASCHFASAGFQAGRQQGIGDGGMGFGINGEGRAKDPNYVDNDLDVQPIKSPSAMNTAFQEVMLWNGQFGATGINAGTEDAWTADTPKENNHLGFQGLETQAIAGLTVHRMEIDMEVLEQYGYDDLFDAAFPDAPIAARYTLVNAGLAIAAYERTLFSSEAPFQLWLKGDLNAMTEEEKQGAIVFFDKGECADCHTGPALSSMTFHAIGMEDLNECPLPVFKATESSVENLGRGGFTGNPEENYKFKTPQLYNLKDSPFYGHGSSMNSLTQVVEYKNAAVPENPDVLASQLSPMFTPKNLTNEEVAQLVTFLETALYDPNLARYEPASLPSGFCFPNNDYLSNEHTGCE